MGIIKTEGGKDNVVSFYCPIVRADKIVNLETLDRDSFCVGCSKSTGSLTWKTRQPCETEAIKNARESQQ